MILVNLFTILLDTLNLFFIMRINKNLCQQFIDDIPLGIYCFDILGNSEYQNNFISNIITKNNISFLEIVNFNTIKEQFNSGILEGCLEYIINIPNPTYFRNCWKTYQAENETIIKGTLQNITETKEISNKFEENKVKFLELFNQMAQGVVYQNKNGEIIDANPAALKILGLSKEQILGRTSVIKEWKAVNEDGKPFDSEDHPAMYTLRTGKPLFGTLMGIYNPQKEATVWLLVSSIPHNFDENGIPQVVFVTFEDITELRKWQVAVYNSEERFRKLLNSTRDIIFLKDRNYRYLLVNSAFENFLDLKEQEVLGKSDFELFPEYLANKFYKSDQEILANNSIYDGYESINDRIFEVQKFSVPLTENEIGIGGILRDITDIYEANKKIHESEEKYRLLIENQTDLLVKVNINGEFLFVSPSYCKMFGKSEKELLGKKFIPLVHPEDRESTLKEMQKLYSPPYTCYLEQRALTVDGWKWIGWHDKAIVDIHGNIIEIIGNGHDITDKKNLELELLKLKQKLS